MEYGILVHWKYQAIAFYALIGMSMLTSEPMLRGGLLRKLTAQVVSLVIGVVPVGLLMYSLYIVSFKL